jgi:hypothetical protein
VVTPFETIKKLIRSHAMSRKVSYNFLIGDDGSGHPSSSRDVLGQVADLEDVGESLHHAHGPGVLIKVLDREANGKLHSAVRAENSHLHLGLLPFSPTTRQDATCTST